LLSAKLIRFLSIRASDQANLTELRVKNMQPSTLARYRVVSTFSNTITRSPWVYIGAPVRQMISGVNIVYIRSPCGDDHTSSKTENGRRQFS
jgi:hypothetical protein